MFDIGFWELAVIAVVALLVVGPDEFPALVRNTIGFFGKMRRFISAVKDDLEYEVDKAEELKKLIAKETQLAELQKTLEEQATTAVPSPKPSRPKPVTDESTDESVSQGPGQEPGQTQSDRTVDRAG